MLKKTWYYMGISIMLLLFVPLIACAPNQGTTGQTAQTGQTGQTNQGNTATPGGGNPTQVTGIVATPTIVSKPTQSAGGVIIPPQPIIATPTPQPIPTTPPSSQGTNITPTIPTTSTTAGTALQQAAQAVFTAINQERAGAHLPALQWSTALVGSAHQHNLTMMAANQLSHQLPNEPDFGTRITNQGLIWSSAAENIGYGWGDPTSAAVGLNQSMFAETPPNNGHHLNILSGNTFVGVDVVVNPQNNQVWLTEDFAKPL